MKWVWATALFVSTGAQLAFAQSSDDPESVIRRLVVAIYSTTSRRTTRSRRSIP